MSKAAVIVRFSGPAWTFGIHETIERLVGPEAATEALRDATRQRKVTTAELSRVLEVLPSRRLETALDLDMRPNLAASVRARLLNQARPSGEEFQRTLTRYAAERLL